MNLLVALRDSEDHPPPTDIRDQMNLRSSEKGPRCSKVKAVKEVKPCSDPDDRTDPAGAGGVWDAGY